MALQKRHLVAACRLTAALGALTLRGRRRCAAWMAHDFLWLYPTLRRNCCWHGNVATQFRTDRPEVWLTIDDGPDPRDTPEMLDVLARHGARATFFVIGKKAEKHRPLLRRIVREGHALGNHTFSHPSAAWWALPRPLVAREMRQCNEVILVATGHTPRWFRPPVGMTPFALHPVAARLGLRVVGWSAAGRDGCPATPTQIVTRIAATLRPGAIILLHESGETKHRVHTLTRLLTRIDAEGLRCVLPPEEVLC